MRWVGLVLVCVVLMAGCMGGEDAAPADSLGSGTADLAADSRADAPEAVL